MDFIDSDQQKWYPAEGDATADNNWRKWIAKVENESAGKTEEGYLWFPAVHYSPANRGPNPQARCTQAMVDAEETNGHGDVCKRVHRGNDVEAIIIHTTEGWSGGGRTFMKGNRRASAHYGIERDGTITQSVLDKDRAWHAPGANGWGIGIEHSAFAKDNPNNSKHLGFTQAQIDASAKLVAKLVRKYNIPITRGYIFGHNEVGKGTVPGSPQGKGGHSDPGPYWDWDNYLRLVKYYYYRRYYITGGVIVGAAALGFWVYFTYSYLQDD